MGELTSKQFWADVVVRAIRTMVQTAVGVIGTATVMSDVKWGVVISSVLLSGLTSVLMSLDRIGTAQSGANVPPSVPGGTLERPQALANGTPQGEGGASQ